MIKTILKFTAITLVLWVVAALVCGVILAANSDPWDGTGWNTSAPDIDQSIGDSYKEIQDLRKGVAIRVNKEHETLSASSAGGVHKQGSARAFFQDAEPATQVDGSAFDSGDLGSLWFDSNASPDNQFFVLTATTPTWTPVSTEVIAIMVAQVNQWADVQTFDVQAVFTLGLLANGSITLGAGDDLIGSATSDITFNTDKFTVAGASGNTLVGGTLDVVGNIDPTSYETTRGGFLDENDMSTDSATAVASQQSIKAYIDTKMGANDAALAKGWAKFAGGDGSLSAGYNITSTARDAVGKYTVTWDTNFGDADYVVVATTDAQLSAGVSTIAAGTVVIWVTNTSGAQVDPGLVFVTAYGPQ